MPYQKPAAISGALDTIEIVNLDLNIEAGTADVFLRELVIGGDGRASSSVRKVSMGAEQFASIAGAVPVGSTLYDAIKAAVYAQLIASGDVPPESDGWAVV
jgi:hypothetical protein